MKDRFNGSRFLALAKKDYRENMLFNLIFIAIMLVAILLAVTQGNPFQVEYSYLPNERIKSDYISHYKDLYIQIFWGLFVVFSACYALRSFRGIMQPDRTLANLMLPVSNLERYLLAFLNSTVVIFIVYLLLFYGVTSITNSYKYVGLKEFSFVTGGWFGNELPQFGPGQEVTHTEIGNIFQVVSENQIKIQQAYSGGHIANSFIPFSVLGIWCIAISCWLGVISMFGFQEQDDSMLDAMSQEIVHSAKIEGQILDHDSIRSSVARQLGLAYDGLPVPDHYTEGIVQVMIDATQHYDMPLDAERLFNWHAALFPMGRSGMYKITVGAWRSEGGSMQVVSGAIGHGKVHYGAPDNKDVPAMMNEFLGWVNAADISMDPLVKAAAAHLWFVTIHPFDDGNGRLCRTITEMLLSRADQTRQRYYSLSSVFLSNRKEYYRRLEQAQKGALDITAWIDWFLRQLRDALLVSLEKTEHVKAKRMFWERYSAVSFNDRQRRIINMLLDGVKGKLTSSKWYKINHCSQDTANRDINALILKGILVKTPGNGRNTAYELAAL